MAIVSFLRDLKNVGTKFKTNNSDIDRLVVDATISRSTNLENEVTMHPVEEGPDVTDHIRTKPVTLQIDGLISETPLKLDAQKAGLVSSGASFANRSLGGFKGGVGSTVVGAGAGKLGARLFQSQSEEINGVKYSGAAAIGRAVLENFLINKERFRIVAGAKFYDNMVMTRLSIPEDNQTGRALKFSCTLQQITIVRGETVLIEKIAQSAAHTAGKKTNLGAQATTEATAQKRTSIIKAGVNKLGGLFGGG